MTQNSWKILVTKSIDDAMHCYFFFLNRQKWGQIPVLGNPTHIWRWQLGNTSTDIVYFYWQFSLVRDRKYKIWLLSIMFSRWASPWTDTLVWTMAIASPRRYQEGFLAFHGFHISYDDIPLSAGRFRGVSCQQGCRKLAPLAPPVPDKSHLVGQNEILKKKILDILWQKRRNLTYFHRIIGHIVKLLLDKLSNYYWTHCPINHFWHTV